MGLAARAMVKHDDTLMVKPPQPDDMVEKSIPDLAPKDATNGDLLLGEGHFVDIQSNIKLDW